MKVFIYYAGFPNTGGPTTRLRVWGCELSRRGHQVTLAGLGRIWHKVSIDIPGVKYFHTTYIPAEARLVRRKLISPEIWCKGLLRHLRETPYDIVHCVGPHCTTAPVLEAARTSGAKTLYTETSTGTESYPEGFHNCSALLSGVHAPTHSIVELVCKRIRFSGKTFVFPGGCDGQLLFLKNPPANRLSAGYVGSLKEFKCVERLVCIWKFVKQILPSAQLHLFGEGPLEGKLRRYVRRNNLERNVVFHGFERDRTKIFSLFSMLVVLIEEGQCFAVAEALASGREVVLMSHGCFPELYGDCKAVHMLSPEASDAEIAQILVKLLTISELLNEDMRSAARAHFDRHFSPELAGKNLMTCYETLLR